jgi:hypothetical protein
MWYAKAEAVGSHKIEVNFAPGNGGNKIYLVPSLHIVIASPQAPTTNTTENNAPRMTFY